MLKKKSSSTEKKRKHSQSEERHDGHKRRSAESNLAVRDWRELHANAKFVCERTHLAKLFLKNCCFRFGLCFQLTAHNENVVVV